MSSYLTFYIKTKEENSKPLHLVSYSRNTEIYQYFYENINPAYIGLEEIKYTELSVSNVDLVINDMLNDIGKARKRIEEYEKHAGGNQEIIEEILNYKEYIEDLEYWLHKVEFIKDLVQEASYDWTSYDKILCNVD